MLAINELSHTKKPKGRSNTTLCDPAGEERETGLRAAYTGVREEAQDTDLQMVTTTRIRLRHSHIILF